MKYLSEENNFLVTFVEVRIISSIFLFVAAASMLISTTGVRISQHWCGDQLVNATIWGEAEPCSHSMEMVDCPIHGKMAVEKNCCDQRASIIDAIENDFFSSSIVFNYMPIAFDLVTTQLESQLITRDLDSKHHLNHSPPLIAQRTHKVFETYLI